MAILRRANARQGKPATANGENEFAPEVVFAGSVADSISTTACRIDRISGRLAGPRSSAGLGTMIRRLLAAQRSGSGSCSKTAAFQTRGASSLRWLASTPQQWLRPAWSARARPCLWREAGNRSQTARDLLSCDCSTRLSQPGMRSRSFGGCGFGTDLTAAVTC